MLDIVTFGSEILGRKAEPVMEIDDGIRALATDMLEAMAGKAMIGCMSRRMVVDLIEA